MKGFLQNYIFIYIAIISLTAFILYGIDKRKAKKRKWRIPEKTLLGIGLLGGFAGGLLGMQAFRHKTKHWYFYAVNLISLLIWCVLLWKIYI